MKKYLFQGIGQFLKIWWMVFWRMELWQITWTYTTTSYPLFNSLWAGGIAFVFVVVFRSSIRIWPIFQLITFHNPFFRIGKHSSKISKKSKKSTINDNESYSPPTIRPAVSTIERATSKGRITGFEPHVLEALSLQKSPWILGDPGFGLDFSNFDQSSIDAGKAGERNFAKALQKAGLINGFQSFWSVAIPDRRNFEKSREYQGDIDCVLFNGKTIFLIDLKNYKGGAITYKQDNNGLYAIDDATQQRVQVSSKMSRNMEMAQENMRKHVGSAFNVISRVVIMPQNWGEARVEGVYWPGNIKCVNLTTMLAELAMHAGFNESYNHTWVSGKLAALVK
jgi:hypothetical protein